MKIIAIGRHPDSDIVLNDPTVSGKHAEVIIDDHNLMTYVDHSTNGTYINGEFVQNASRHVTTNDVIKFPDESVLDWKLIVPPSSMKTVPFSHGASYQELQSLPSEPQYVPPVRQPEPVEPVHYFETPQHPIVVHEQPARVEMEYKVKKKHKIMRGFAFGSVIASMVIGLVIGFVYVPEVEYLVWGMRFMDVALYVILAFLASNFATRLSSGLLAVNCVLSILPVESVVYYVLMNAAYVYLFSLIMVNNDMDINARRWAPLLILSVIGNCVTVLMYSLMPYIAYMPGSELWSGGYNLFQGTVLLVLFVIANYRLIYSSAFDGNYDPVHKADFNPINKYFIAIVIAIAIGVLANYLIITL